MKFQFMEMHQETHSVGKMAKIFNVSRSGYYAWCLRRRREQNEEGNDLGDLISSIQSDLRYTYGAKRMTAELKRRGYEVNHKRVARIMRENGLQVRRKKRFRSTTNSEHDNPVAENVLDRQFEVETPDTAYVSDITYVPTAEGWMYLCIILDLASRKIVGWSTSARMTADLAIDAITAALVRQQLLVDGVIFHSDRGCQYCSRKVRKILKRNGFVQSMSRKGNCWDNAVAESFFKTLKSELCGISAFRTRQIARLEVFDYIEIFYNRKRLHSSIGYVTPVEYERQAARRVA
jgi:putative transposase